MKQGGQDQAERKEGGWVSVFKRVVILSLTKQALYARRDERSFDKYKCSFHRDSLNTGCVCQVPGWMLGIQSWLLLYFAKYKIPWSQYCLALYRKILLTLAFSHYLI